MTLDKFVSLFTLLALTVTGAFSAPKTRLEAETITIGTGGFHLTKIVRPHGPFFLIVRNHSDISNLSLVLAKSTREHVQDTPLQLHGESAGVLDLTPGDYLLTEVGHPGWKCAITITAH
jgi:hypothetical protein